MTQWQRCVVCWGHHLQSSLGTRDKLDECMWAVLRVREREGVKGCENVEQLWVDDASLGGEMDGAPLQEGLRACRHVPLKGSLRSVTQ